MTEEEAAVAAQRSAFENRMAKLEQLYISVDEILSFISTDKTMQEMIATFELTANSALDQRQRSVFESIVRPRLADSDVNITVPRDIETVFSLAYDEIIGISVMGDLWRDETVDEILIDAWNRIVVERFGQLQPTGYRFRTPEHAERVARTLSTIVSDRSVSRANPIPTAVLPAARVQFVYGQIVSSGLAIAIRKFKALMGMPELLARGSLSDEMAAFLADAVAARATILVAGGVGTGKTTMINALSQFIPDTERVLTIEDAFELQLSNRHVVSLQAKLRSHLDDAVTVSLEDLLVTSLRMRPDRIVVGEVREPAAATTMIQAANTGHDGTMTTVHASSSLTALNSRMTSFLMRSSAGFSEATARMEVATAFDLVIQIERGPDRRYIAEIALVDPRWVTDARIEPRILFAGHLSPDLEEVEFARVAPLDPDSPLATKFRHAGLDASRWTAPLP